MNDIQGYQNGPVESGASRAKEMSLKRCKNWGVGSNRSNSYQKRNFLKKIQQKNWLVYKLGFFDY